MNCGTDGQCDDTGTCEFYASGTACGSMCMGDMSSPGTCDGQGNCQPGGLLMPCAPYTCQAGACLTSCATDTQCASTAFCNSADLCKAKRANGVACTEDDQCTSGYCNLTTELCEP